MMPKKNEGWKVSMNIVISQSKILVIQDKRSLLREGSKNVVL